MENNETQTLADSNKAESIALRRSDATQNAPGSWFVIISALMVGLSILFTVIGLYKLYDNSYSSQIVGGDAYNYIIYATRGTAWVCAGVAAAVLSVTFALFGKLQSK